ncbi:uncharacterized protein LOC129585237 isoform X2 [Paramacrobiotus metropolitanus]|nr:uncharacterized protein LOC129585237 isoform X2 [Paramacrobiotus metropolitanus]XP_055333820.1 uncharacterized protein LOC129585237 isoform X2 [Paramacrobiotus metropolitanus]
MRAQEIWELTQRLEPFLHLKHVNVVRHLHHQTVITRQLPEQRNGEQTSMPQYQILMEYCSGGTLHSYARDNIMSASLIQKWTQQLVSGLTYLHKQQCVHRDIKSENIFLSTPDAHNCDLKIGDLGNVKRIVAQFTDSSEISCEKGTYEFMSPEMITGNPALVGRRTDVWSLGCVVIQMITGHAPYFYKVLPQGKEVQLTSGTAIMYFVGKLGGMPRIPNGLPEPMRRFVERCLIRSVRERPYAPDLQGDAFLLEREADQWTMPQRNNAQRN